MIKFSRLFIEVACLLLSYSAWAASFTSTDGVFTLDLPPGWKKATTSDSHTVLALRKNTSAMDIKSISCETETCLDSRINHDLADVKSKKMTVITNTYTGEEIKRIEFATGEPLYYISFFTQKNDFSAGYFLINGHAYSILAKNITYAEADLLFSFFSPARKALEPSASSEEISIEVDENSPLSYEISSLPEVEVESVEAIEPPIEQEDFSDPIAIEAGSSSIPLVEKTSRVTRFKNTLLNLRSKTLISPNMPPGLRSTGRFLDLLIALIAIYFSVWFGALLLRPFISPRKEMESPSSTSLYPIRAKRLYGTPALIWRTKDNRGNVLISSGSRWNSICICFGISALLLTLSILTFTSLAEHAQLLSISSLTYSTIYATCTLILPLGCLLILTGIIWGLLILREVTLFDRKGKKAVTITQKGFPLLYEKYEINFLLTKDSLCILRKRFSILRQWQLLNEQGVVTSTFVESSLVKSILRRLFGHLWGFLRTDYNILGPKHLQGTLTNTHALFNRFVCNVSFTDELPARHALAITALISLRDRDKWYPWFN